MIFRVYVYLPEGITIQAINRSRDRLLLTWRGLQHKISKTWQHFNQCAVASDRRCPNPNSGPQHWNTKPLNQNYENAWKNYMIYIYDIYIYHSHANQSNVLNPINLQLGIVWIPPTSGKSSAMCSWNWLYHMNPDLKSVSISSYQSVSPIMWPSTNTYHILIHRNMDDISYYPWTSTIPSEKLARSW